MKIAVKNNLVVSTAEDFILDNKGRYNHNISLTPDTCEIVDNVTLPDNFIAGCFTYVNGTFTATADYQTRLDEIAQRENEALATKKQSLLLSEILVLENKITQRRIREAMLSGDYSFINDIESQIVNKRIELNGR